MWLNLFPFFILEGVYRFHDFAVTIPGCFKDVYVISFFPRTGSFWNSLPINPLTYDLNYIKALEYLQKTKTLKMSLFFLIRVLLLD